jgi:hypothetical protein
MKKTTNNSVGVGGEREVQVLAGRADDHCDAQHEQRRLLCAEGQEDTRRHCSRRLLQTVYVVVCLQCCVELINLFLFVLQQIRVSAAGDHMTLLNVYQQWADTNYSTQWYVISMVGFFERENRTFLSNKNTLGVSRISYSIDR